MIDTQAYVWSSAVDVGPRKSPLGGLIEAAAATTPGATHKVSGPPLPFPPPGSKISTTSVRNDLLSAKPKLYFYFYFFIFYLF
jgi:hypothetical protein